MKSICFFWFRRLRPRPRPPRPRPRKRKQLRFRRPPRRARRRRDLKLAAPGQSDSRGERKAAEQKQGAKKKGEKKKKKTPRRQRRKLAHLHLHLSPSLPRPFRIVLIHLKIPKCLEIDSDDQAVTILLSHGSLGLKEKQANTRVRLPVAVSIFFTFLVKEEKGGAVTLSLYSLLARSHLLDFIVTSRHIPAGRAGERACVLLDVGFGAAINTLRSFFF